MNAAVLDTSVVARAFFEETHSKKARRILATTQTLVAPELLLVEFTSVVLRKTRAGDITRDEAALMLADFLSLPIRIAPSDAALPQALELAIETEQTIYDCLYLATALRERCTLITADDRFARACRASPFASHVRTLRQLT